MMRRLPQTALACLCAATMAAPPANAPVQPAPQPAIPGASLGRLFFTPAERDELDRIRVGINDNGLGDSSRTVRLDGVVQRNTQPPQFWVNGKPYHGKEVAGATLNPKALNASTVVVNLPPPDPRDVKLRVGQTLDPAGGNLREVYQRPPQELNLLLQALGKRGAAPAKTKDGKPAKPGQPPAPAPGAPTQPTAKTN